MINNNKKIKNYRVSKLQNKTKISQMMKNNNNKEIIWKNRQKGFNNSMMTIIIQIMEMNLKKFSMIAELIYNQFISYIFIFY